ncbi:MAG: helix-turn-helix domain-containing protein [Janthinobacterium lividum]
MQDATETDRCDGRRMATDPAVAGDAPGVAERDSPGAETRTALSLCPLCRTLGYLHSRLAESVSLETLADLNGLSRSSFFRWFRASTGLSPHQWFLQARVEQAKHLLLDGSQPLSDMALELGFTDQAHFGRTFKRLTGTPPGAWQRSRTARLVALPPRPASKGHTCTWH